MRLKLKFILFFSALAALLLVVIIFYSLYEFKDILTTQTHNNLTTIVEGFEGQIFLFLEKNKIQTVDWGSDKYIRSEFGKILETQDEEKIDNLINYIKTIKYPLGTDFTITDIFDLNGRVIVSTDPKRIGHVEYGEELNDEYSFNKALEFSYGNAVATAPIHEGDEPGHEVYKYMWHISAPLYSENIDKKIGVMVNHVSNETIDNILSGRQQIEFGALAGLKFFERFKSGEIYLINKDKKMVSSSRFIEDSIFNQSVDTQPVKECLENKKEFTGLYMNYLGYSVAGASRCFVDHDLILIVEMKSDEIFAELKEEGYHVLGIGVLIVLAGIIIVYFFSNIFLKNIFAIQKAVNQAIKENFNVRVSVKSNDEIKTLADDFNRMIESIKNSEEKLQEARRQLEEQNSNLERRVQRRTEELIQLKNDLENTVLERTKELHEKVVELEKFKELTVGREIKMIELKKEINRLKNGKD